MRRDPALVYRLDYRIIIPGADDSLFKLWVELPLDMAPAADAPPIAPLAFEVEPRSFLRLHFERTG